MKWWQATLTFCLGDGTVKDVTLAPIKHLTRDLRTNPEAYERIKERLQQASEWLKSKQQ